MNGLDGLTDEVCQDRRGERRPRRRGRASAAAHERFGDHVTAAASQPYYLDVTHPQANKGEVVKYLGKPLPPLHRSDRHHRRHAKRRLDVRPLGAQHRHGKRRPQVQRAARRVTDTNENEGFAKAVQRFILPAP